MEFLYFCRSINELYLTPDPRDDYKYCEIDLLRNLIMMHVTTKQQQQRQMRDQSVKNTTRLNIIASPASELFKRCSV